MISVSKDVMAQCNANLRALYEGWDADVQKKCYMVRSRGDTANDAQEWIEETYRLLQAMKCLLENSVAFFSGAAAAFEDADNAAAEGTGSIGGPDDIVVR